MEQHSVFGYIDQYFWVLCLALAGYQYLGARRRVLSTLQRIPGKSRAALAYLRWYIWGTAFPWVVMGCRQLSGSTPTIWYYFRPQDGNPYVLAWVAVLLLTARLFACWVFLADGARKIVDLKLIRIFGSRGNPSASTFRIKFFAALGPLFVLLWIFVAASMDAPLPK